jgi:hypothetical protein
MVSRWHIVQVLFVPKQYQRWGCYDGVESQEDRIHEVLSQNFEWRCGILVLSAASTLMERDGTHELTKIKEVRHGEEVNGPCPDDQYIRNSLVHMRVANH